MQEMFNKINRTKKNEKGFAIVLALVLLLVMSLMGGTLIVISSGDHQNNNLNDEYQQTFYVAETALIEGEKYLINQYLGPWDISTNLRSTDRNVNPVPLTATFAGDMSSQRKNYTLSGSTFTDTEDLCFKSFPQIIRANYKVVTFQSWNFGQAFLDLDPTSFNRFSQDEKDQIDNLKDFYYEFFIERAGSASFTGPGSSIKKGSSDDNKNGMAYRIYGCGIRLPNSSTQPLVISLESIIVLPRI